MTPARPREGCRPVVHRPAFDTLEQRALFTLGAASAAADVAVFVYRGPVETASVGTARQVGRSTTTQATDSGQSESSGGDRAAGGKDVTASPAAHDNSEGTSTDKRLAHDDASRDSAGSIAFVERRTIDETLPIGSADDGPAAEPEPTSGLVAADQLDLEAAAAVVAWAPGLALSPGLANASSGEPAAIGAVLWGPENGKPAVRYLQPPAGALGADPAQLADTTLAADRVSSNTAWGNLVEHALRGEWDAVDAELRQFLARLGGSADGSDEPGFGPSWHVWIGTALAMIVARQALHGSWRLVRRPCPARARHEHPTPLDPWPLSSS
jgi:hypothetical protein